MPILHVRKFKITFTPPTHHHLHPGSLHTHNPHHTPSLIFWTQSAASSELEASRTITVVENTSLNMRGFSLSSSTDSMLVSGKERRTLTYTFGFRLSPLNTQLYTHIYLQAKALQILNCDLRQLEPSFSSRSNCDIALPRLCSFLEVSGFDCTCGPVSSRGIIFIVQPMDFSKQPLMWAVFCL